MYPHLLSFLRTLGELTDEEAAIITQHSKLHTAKEDEVLLREGQQAKELFFICSGILKIVSVNEKGEDVVHFFLRPNQFCTILNSFTNGVPSNESIIAACDTQLVIFSKPALQEIYKLIPHFKLLVEGVTQKTLLEKLRIKNSYGGKDATERYQTFLQQQPDVAARVSLSDAASYLGVTQQSLSRIRKNMRRCTNR